jgi:5'-3' exonuclease
MEVHLIDGTYELFRHFYAVPSAKDARGQEIGAVRAVLHSMLALTREGATHNPSLQGWGMKSAAAVLSHFKHLEHIPLDASEWRLNLTNSAALAKTFAQERDKAFLFRDLATLRTEIALFGSVDDLQWSGPTSAFPLLAARLDSAVRKQRRRSPWSRNAAGPRAEARRCLIKGSIRPVLINLVVGVSDCSS